MKKIVINSDGSYRNKKIGYASAITVDGIENDMKVIYGNLHGTSPMQAEFTAIILGFEYVMQNILAKGEEFFIEIRTDCIIAVEFIEKRQFEEWDKCSWTKGNRPIRSDIRNWYRLALVCKYLGLENIQFIKVNDSEDIKNRMMHHFARKGIKENLLKKGHFNLIKGITCENYLDDGISIENVKIDEFHLGKSKGQMPWCKNKKVKRGENKKVHWINQVKGNLVKIPVSQIIITDIVHLKTDTLNFNGEMVRYAQLHSIDLPIAIREIDNNKYSLVAGVVRLLSAKALGIETIPAYITELEHSEFMEKYG